MRVENRFFGERITVAGLLTGQDLYRALKKEDLGEIVYISRSTQRADEDVFLDDMSLLELQQALGVPVRTLENDRRGFCGGTVSGKGVPMKNKPLVAIVGRPNVREIHLFEPVWWAAGSPSWRIPPA